MVLFLIPTRSNTLVLTDSPHTEEHVEDFTLVLFLFSGPQNLFSFVFS